MSMKELLESKHPTAWSEFEKGLIDEEYKPGYTAPPRVEPDETTIDIDFSCCELLVFCCRAILWLGSQVFCIAGDKDMYLN